MRHAGEVRWTPERGEILAKVADGALSWNDLHDLTGKHGSAFDQLMDWGLVQYAHPIAELTSKGRYVLRRWEKGINLTSGVNLEAVR